MNTDITFIIADNQDITRMGMHGYISAIFSGCRMIDVTDKKELMLALVECNDSVVILDYTLFDINGIEEFLIIEKRFPRVRWTPVRRSASRWRGCADSPAVFRSID